MRLCVAIFLTAFCCLIGSSTSNKTDTPPLVSIPLGDIEGSITETVNERQIFAFEGVPYAAPPVGKHRFKEPIPPKSWVGTWKANVIYQCLQYDHFSDTTGDMVKGEEDCLYVNIYTPTLDPKANLDVIFYIHGGAFMFNAGGYYGPKYLLDRDVVYVNFNYRLGPLGFLSTEDDVVPGNNGIKDQILALKWVNENIEYFGGNPKSITIYGMSAGGASVQTHFLTPKTKGLFQRGFSQSGCILNPWALMENPLETAKKVSSEVGCPTDDSYQMVQCLRKRPARQIVKTVKVFQPWKYNPFSPFGVVVDTWASDPVLSDHPYKLLKDKNVHDLPWLSSHVTSEGLYPAYDFYPERRLKYINENWNQVLPHILHYNFTVDPQSLDIVSQKIREHYLGQSPLDRSTYKQFVGLVGDRLFNVDLEKASRLQAAATKSPVYHYTFDYRGKNSVSNIRSESNDDIGISHADDTLYILNAYVDTRSTEQDKKMSEFLLDLLESFAKTGTPSIGQEWTPVSKKISDPFHHLLIKSPDNIHIESNTSLGNRGFWHSLPFLENEKLIITRDEL